MSKTLQAIRGMNDMLPSDAPYWQLVRATCERVAAAYDYHEARFPVLEPTALFKRSVGETTDIVEKEMYTFEDRNGDSLTLRPEGTASCVRMALQHGLLHNQIQKLWYMGPMYRHERPQKGRYREFYQLGVEAFGIADPAADVELILLSYRLFKEMELAGELTLEINTLGTPDVRATYRDALVAYYQQHQDQLDEDSQRRLHRNPLRILDSKNPEMKALNDNAPKLKDYLDEASQQHFDTVCAQLNALGIEYHLNPTLVRGLDYYCHTVFEWTTASLGAQGTVCAGGRYDGLVEQLGGRATPAVGFAMGFERIILLLQASHQLQRRPDIYVVCVGEPAQLAALKLAEQLRDVLPRLSVAVNTGASSMKSQLKKADKSNARLAILIGEDEVAEGVIRLKDLREDSEQLTLTPDALIAQLQQQE